MGELLYVDEKTYLPCLNLTYTDKMGMAASTEVRVPILDDEVIELAGKIPPNLKLRRLTRKYLFKRAMEPVLPPRIVHRPKAGFGAPVRSWLVGELKPSTSKSFSRQPQSPREDCSTRLLCKTSSGRTRPVRPTMRCRSGPSSPSSCGNSSSSTPRRPSVSRGSPRFPVKQVSQRLGDGRIEVADVPRPALTPEVVLVDVRVSLLSAGTERTKVATGKQSLLGKARSRPDQVRQVIEKARRDGVTETVRAVRARLDQPSPLGYSAAGVVLETGARVTDLRPGDRVACGGGGYAVHAEVDRVLGNLCVRIPGRLSFAEASFATLGAIALHGVRQASVQVGERVAVIGLGLVGQLTAQLLHAAGCSVVAIDLHGELVELAEKLASAEGLMRGEIDEGALSGDCDAVVITAATRSDDPVQLAAHLARDRARVVLVGDVALDIPRARYYEKELEIRLSRSYRTRPLRPRVRGARPRLPDRIRALDGAPKHGRVPGSHRRGPRRRPSADYEAHLDR